MYALDATTGAKAWSFPTGGRVFSSPAVADGVVYVGSEDFNVYALEDTCFPVAKLQAVAPVAASRAYTLPLRISRERRRHRARLRRLTSTGLSGAGG